MKDKILISTSVHPDHLSKWIDWEKYRFIMEGGDEFIEKYLVKYSERENKDDFIDRKAVTPVPGFARAAIIDVKNAIFQRMSDIAREGGSDSYHGAIVGVDGGVDRQNSTMNHFIGRDVLPELLFMGKVGVYVDMPVLSEQPTLTETKNVHPYFYTYVAESIKNWVITWSDGGIEFEKLLLEESYFDYDDIFQLPSESKQRFRLLTKEDGVVLVRFYNSENKQVDSNGEETTGAIELKIKKIPFVLFELEQPLTQDIANHQIALLNMESSDVSYSLKANFPFYTEQYSGRTQSTHLQTNEEDSDGEGEINVGSVQGRRYSKGLDRPDFIHPPSEPLQVSMEKQKILKEDIRMLINLALGNVKSKFASAEAKEMDERGLESGLSALGLILEQGERELAVIYSNYENDNRIATIKYPARYSLKTDAQRLNEAGALGDQMAVVPSKKFQKAISKEIAKILLDAKVSTKDYLDILKEIDDAPFISSDAEIIHSDIERGLVSLETASKARGYSEDEVEKAAIDHAKRLVRIKESQSNDEGARGISDEDSLNNDSAKLEKTNSQDPDISEHGQKAVRGEE